MIVSCVGCVVDEVVDGLVKSDVVETVEVEGELVGLGVIRVVVMEVSAGVEVIGVVVVTNVLDIVDVDTSGVAVVTGLKMAAVVFVPGLKIPPLTVVVACGKIVRRDVVFVVACVTLSDVVNSVTKFVVMPTTVGVIACVISDVIVDSYVDTIETVESVLTVLGIAVFQGEVTACVVFADVISAVKPVDGWSVSTAGIVVIWSVTVCCVVASVADGVVEANGVDGTVGDVLVVSAVVVEATGGVVLVVRAVVVGGTVGEVLAVAAVVVEADDVEPVDVTVVVAFAVRVKEMMSNMSRS